MATSQYIRFPASPSAASSNASVGLTGTTAPTSATEIGAIFGGNLVALKADSSSNLLVSVASSVVPTGGATAANQVLEIADLDAINAKTPALGQALAAGSVPVVLTAAQLTTLTPLPTVTVNQGTTPWSENISQINGVTPLMGNGITGTGSLRVTVASDNTPIPMALPTGASTSALQTALNAQIPTTLGQKAMAASLAVTIASDQSAVPVSGTITVNPVAGYSNAQFVRNDYTSVNVTTGAYVQLIASTTATTQWLYIQDTSGQTLKLATGAAASEVDKIIIPQGGLSCGIPLTIAAGTRISIRAISATAAVGEIDLQLLG